MCTGPVNIKHHLRVISLCFSRPRGTHHILLIASLQVAEIKSLVSSSATDLTCIPEQSLSLFSQAKGNIRFLIISIPEFSRMETWGLKVSVRWPHNRGFICGLGWKTHHSRWLRLSVMERVCTNNAEIKPAEFKTSLSEKCYANPFPPPPV